VGRFATPTSSAPHLGSRFAVGHQDTSVRSSSVRREAGKE